MTLEELEEAFEAEEDGIMEFDQIEKKRSPRKDLHAFLLLDSLVPSDDDIVSAAEHDQIYLGTDIDKFAAVATPEIVKELSRCGVFIDEGSLAMFA